MRAYGFWPGIAHPHYLFCGTAPDMHEYGAAARGRVVFMRNLKLRSRSRPGRIDGIGERMGAKMTFMKRGRYSSTTSGANVTENVQSHYS